MKTYNKLVHDNVTDILKDQGYDKLQGKKLKGKKYKAELYSLFFHEYKETLRKDKPQQLQVHYAEMLEVIRTLMMATKTNIKDVDLYQNQSMDWYKNASRDKDKLTKSRIDLLQNFYELLSMKTEAVKDQLTDVLTSFKQLVESHKLSFIQVEEARRTIFKKLGGFSKGVYLVSVSKTNTYSV